MVRRREFLKLGAAAALFPGPGLAAGAGADAQFQALLAQLTVPDGPPDETFAGVSAAREGQAAMRERLRAFDPAALSPAARLDYDGILEGLDLEIALWLKFPIGTVGMPVSPYVLSPRSGSYLAPAGATAANIGGETDRFRSDAIYAHDLPPDFIVDATLTKMIAARATAPAGLAAPLDFQIATLKSLRDLAGPQAGVRMWRGYEYYERALRIGTSLSITPRAAHDEGLRQVETLSERADALLRTQGLKSGSVGARLHALGQDARYLYSDDDAGRALVATQMNARLARARSVLPRVFTGLSPAAVSVAIARPGKIGYRVAPSYDGTTPGAYYADLRDIRRRPSWSLPTVVHHETLPGHLLQLPLQEHAAPLRLRYTPNAFFEGWAIYAEELADELGLFDGDDLGRLGMLQSLLVRAARLVIDTGIHFKRWSREQAMARFFDIAGDAPDTLQNEVDRIAVQPGTTAGPALGRAKIWALRKSFGGDPMAFHTALLKHGALRLSLLERALAS